LPAPRRSLARSQSCLAKPARANGSDGADEVDQGFMLPQGPLQTVVTCELPTFLSHRMAAVQSLIKIAQSWVQNSKFIVPAAAVSSLQSYIHRVQALSHAPFHKGVTLALRLESQANRADRNDQHQESASLVSLLAIKERYLGEIRALFWNFAVSGSLNSYQQQSRNEATTLQAFIHLMTHKLTADFAALYDQLRAISPTGANVTTAAAAAAGGGSSGHQAVPVPGAPAGRSGLAPAEIRARRQVLLLDFECYMLRASALLVWLYEHGWGGASGGTTAASGDSAFAAAAAAAPVDNVQHHGTLAF